MDSEQKILRKVSARLMPLLVFAMIVSYIDRQNVAFAKLQMVSALHMSETAYGLGSSLFFIGYICFDLPSSLALHRYGARVWLARIMATWGVITILLAFSARPVHFFVLRFLLGAAEAGFYPGCVYYLTLWFPREQRARALGIFTIGAPLGSMIGALAGGALLELNGRLGLAGWQWNFLVTGVPAIAMAVVLFVWLPSRPADATFLQADERRSLVEALDRENEDLSSHGSPVAALWNPRVLAFGGAYMLLSTALYGVNYWLPTLVKSFGVRSGANGLLNMIPWGLAVLLLLIVPRRLRSQRAVLAAAATAAIVGLALFLGSVAAPAHTLQFAAICLGAPCVQILYPLFWSVATRFFKGAHAASSVAVINAIGLLGGFAAQNLMPWVGHLTRSAVMPMLTPAVCLGCLGVLAWLRWQATSPGVELRAPAL